MMRKKRTGDILVDDSNEEKDGVTMKSIIRTNYILVLCLPSSINLICILPNRILSMTCVIINLFAVSDLPEMSLCYLIEKFDPMMLLSLFLVDKSVFLSFFI